MPYVDLFVTPSATPAQAEALARGVTAALEETLGKRREVTAVRVAGGELLWTIGGEPAREPTAYLEARITAGSNSEEEKARLLRRLHALLTATLGGLAEASYIVIHELPAGDWGYGGISQAARHPPLVGARP